MFDLTAWQLWLAVGFVLLFAEMVAPGIFLLWFGAAALVVGVLVWLIPALAWPLQALLFAVISAALVLYYRHLRAKYDTEASDQPLLNNPLEQMVGQVHALHTAIENGRGRVKIGDALWSVSGADLPAGQRVKVTAIDDMVLMVEPVSA